MDLRGMTALVTGASSGIGLEFARQLAKAGANLVLVARRKEKLEALAAELSAAHGVQAQALALDLADPATRRAAFDRTEASGIAIDVLINNAGFGTHRTFLATEWQSSEQQIQLNVLGLTELCWRFGRAMAERGRGWILNVSSTQSYLPVPEYATYCAGKAYVTSLGYALARELRPRGVCVCTLCPGPTDTEFMNVAGHRLVGLQKLTLMTAERCARIGLRALWRGRHNVVPGFSNKLLVLILALIPRRLITAVVGRFLGRASA